MGQVSVHRSVLGGLSEQRLGGRTEVLLLPVGDRRRRTHLGLQETRRTKTQEVTHLHPSRQEAQQEAEERRTVTFRVPTLSSKDLKVGAFLWGETPEMREDLFQTFGDMQGNRTRTSIHTFGGHIPTLRTHNGRIYSCSRDQVMDSTQTGRIHPPRQTSYIYCPIRRTEAVTSHLMTGILAECCSERMLSGSVREERRR